MANAKMDFKKIQSWFFLGLILIFGITSLYIFRPFLFPIFWASILSIMFYPIYQKLYKSTKHSSLSAGLTLLLIVAVVVIPLLFIATLVANESSTLYEKVRTVDVFESVNNVRDQLGSLPVIGKYIQNLQTQGPEFAQNAASVVSSFLFENLKALTQYSIKFMFLFFMMLYALFYFLRDGKRMLNRLMHLSPLGDEYEAMLYERFTSTARATLKGTVITGTIQGTIGGILFAATGIEGALIWGVLMTLLSIIPGVGSSIIWFPAGLIMLAIGNVWQGFTILAVGVGVISIIDNLIRPPLVGRDTQMHPILILFSTLGGIAVFGISGFVIGPVVIALFLAIISIYDHYYKRELTNN